MKDLTEEERVVLTGLSAAMNLAHRTAVNAGWHMDVDGRPVERNFGELIALMHSELSEALEAHRTNSPDAKLPHRSGVEVELADCLLRIFDAAAMFGLDLPTAVIEKNRFSRFTP